MIRNARRAAETVIVIALLGFVCGCAAMSVKPWDRDLLAKRRMRFTPSATQYQIDEHIYFSKEGSLGGHGVGGGGCGCN